MTRQAEAARMQRLGTEAVSVTAGPGIGEERAAITARPKLLIICNVAWFFLSHRLPFAKAAKDLGFDVHVAADVESPDEVRAIRDAGLSFHPVALSRSGLNVLEDARLARRLSEICRELRPKLVHNMTIKPVIYGTWAAQLSSVPTIVNTITGMGYVFSDARSRRGLRAVVRAAYRTLLDRPGVTVIFENEDDRRQFMDQGIVGAERTAVIEGAGVDLDVFRFEPEPAGTPMVLLPARLLRDKGVLEFGSAAAELRRRGSDARFVIAGRRDRANRACLKDEEVQWLERACGVEWLGNRADVARLMRDSSVICLPSYMEGLPKALVEACATGRAIVTTDVPGCRAVVRHGINGLLVPARDPVALTEALWSLLEDVELRARMGRAGRERAERDFEVARLVNQTMSLYRRLLNLPMNGGAGEATC